MLAQAARRMCVDLAAYGDHSVRTGDRVGEPQARHGFFRTPSSPPKPVIFRSLVKTHVITNRTSIKREGVIPGEGQDWVRIRGSAARASPSVNDEPRSG